MLSDTDLLAIVRMREANSSKVNKDGEQKTGKEAAAKSSGVAASSDAKSPDATKLVAEASEGKAEQPEHTDSERSPAP